MAPKLQFAGLVALIVVVNLLGGSLSSATHGSAAALAAWLITIALLTLCLVLIGRLPPVVDWRGVIIDQRNRISLSRLQLVLWSILVISGLITEGTLNAVWQVPTPLDLHVPQELWVLLGLSSATAVAAPIVLGTKTKADLSFKDPDAQAWRDMFYGDDGANADQVDFSKVQQFFLTIVLILVYAIAIGTKLLFTLPNAALCFPQLDPGFIGILAVSQAAYIAYKAVPQKKTDAPS